MITATLRRMTDEDLHTVFAARNDEEVIRFSDSGKAISYQEFEALFKFNKNHRLVFEYNGKMSGYIELSRFNEDEGYTTWSFFLFPEARGKKLSTLMLDLSLRVLKDMPFDRVKSTVHKNNLPSIALHKKLGFESRDGSNGMATFWKDL